MLPTSFVMIGRGASSNSTVRSTSMTMRRAASSSPSKTSSRIFNRQLLQQPSKKGCSNPSVAIKLPSSSSRMMSSVTATMTSTNARLLHQRFGRPSVLLSNRTTMTNTSKTLQQQQQQRRAFHGGYYNSGELPSCLQPKLLPSHEIALDVVGWYVALALLYPLYLRSSDGEGVLDDDGSWRDAHPNNHDDDDDDAGHGHGGKNSHKKSSSGSHKEEGDHRH